MDSFSMNGYLWHVKFVNPYSLKLVDRTRILRVATTDPNDLCIYLSEELKGDFLIRVFIHELGHCVMFSFNLIEELHRMVYKEYWIEAEEWVCNFIADYGMKVFKIAYSIIGNYNAWIFVPKELEKIVS